MANRIKGEVSLKLEDGREFILVADMEALVEAEGIYGKPLGETMADAARGFVGASRAMLYGALRAKHPDITLREAADMLATDSTEVSERLAEAADKAFPDAKGKAGNAPSRKAGKRSGSSGAKRG